MSQFGIAAACRGVARARPARAPENEPERSHEEDRYVQRCLFSRHGKLQTDQAISRAYRELAPNPRRIAAFSQLLHVTRTRSPLLAHPIADGTRHVQVDALRNLAMFHTDHARAIDRWPGANGSPRSVIASLAQYLLARYPMPRFLCWVWFGDRSREAWRRRDWFVSHGFGQRFRELDLPMTMTRKMEHLFLQSPDHLSIEQAMRRAELLSLGAGAPLVDAVLATRLGRDLSHGRFWRTVMAFLASNAGELPLHQVGPIIDFLQFMRYEQVAVYGPYGVDYVAPPHPGFSLKGRTLRSLLRLVDDWHRGLGRGSAGTLAWAPSHHRPWVYSDQLADTGAPTVLWEFVELTSSKELKLEGIALHHCVATYAHDCYRGRSRIFSLRRRVDEKPVRSILTIEVSPSTQTIVQARGMRNRPARGKPFALLEMWARRENLRLQLQSRPHRSEHTRALSSRRSYHPCLGDGGIIEPLAPTTRQSWRAVD